jgi:hypothetical protein
VSEGLEAGAHEVATAVQLLGELLEVPCHPGGGVSGVPGGCDVTQHAWQRSESRAPGREESFALGVQLENEAQHRAHPVHEVIEVALGRLGSIPADALSQGGQLAPRGVEEVHGARERAVAPVFGGFLLLGFAGC